MRRPAISIFFYFRRPRTSNKGNDSVYAFGPDAVSLVSKVNARGNSDGFTMLEMARHADILFLRRDRAEPLIALPWRVRARLVS